MFFFFFFAFPPAQAVKSRKVLDDYILDVTDTIEEMDGWDELISWTCNRNSL